MEVFDNQSEEHPFQAARHWHNRMLWDFMMANLALSFAIASRGNTSLRHLEIMLYLLDLALNRGKISEITIKSYIRVFQNGRFCSKKLQISLV